MRHFFFPCANRGASLVHAHVCRKGGKITGHGVIATVLLLCSAVSTPSFFSNMEIVHWLET